MENVSWTTSKFKPRFCNKISTPQLTSTLLEGYDFSFFWGGNFSSLHFSTLCLSFFFFFLISGGRLFIYFRVFLVSGNSFIHPMLGCLSELFCFPRWLRFLWWKSLLQFFFGFYFRFTLHVHTHCTSHCYKFITFFLILNNMFSWVKWSNGTPFFWPYVLLLTIMLCGGREENTQFLWRNCFQILGDWGL